MYPRHIFPIIRTPSMGASNRVFAIVVTFYPNPNELEALLSAVAPQVDRIGIVDNTPLKERSLGLGDILFSNNIQLFFEKQNVGVGTAHNR